METSIPFRWVMWKTKEKQREYNKQYYLKNRKKKLDATKKFVEQNREKSRQYKQRYKQKQKRILNELILSLKTKCSECDEISSCCLEFHHMDDKFKTVSKLRDMAYSTEMVLMEISKCIILCSNCHRKKHYKNKTYNNPKGRLIKKLKNESCCFFCQEDSPPCLDFHHISNKEINIGAMIRNKNYSLDELKSELKKCICVCSNCHRKLHKQELTYSTGQ